MVKAPRPPETLLFDAASDVTVFDGPLWRVFRSAGDHPTSWDQLRYFGPVKGMRFDPHPPPPGTHPRGVMYASRDLPTALAEVYQGERVVSSDRGASIASWIPTRPLNLIDLTGTWLIRNGASASLAMGAKRYTQEWAELIDRQLGGHIDGLSHNSTLTGSPIVTLFQRGIDPTSMPERPDFHRLVSDQLAQRLISRAVTTIGYSIR